MAAARPRPASAFPGGGRLAGAPGPWVFVLLAVAVLAVAALVILALMPKEPTAAGPNDPAARPTPEAPATVVPIAPEASPTPVPDDGTPRPASCEELYSPSMVAAMGDLVLNPAWGAEPGAEVLYGTDDAELRGIIDTADNLNCAWGVEAGGSDIGVVTDLVWVTPELSGTVKARLAAAGLNCYEERGGIRCIIHETSESGTFGESHFLREGIWLATKYSNAGPDGYTLDMVGSLWAAA